jgi:hypothetical protein
MMDVLRLLEKFEEREGWNSDTLLGLLVGFLESRDTTEGQELETYLQSHSSQDESTEMTMKVSLDGGVTWMETSQGVRVIYRGLFVPGEDGRGELQVNCTSEGIIKDVWVEKGDSYPNIATSSVTVDEIVSQMIEDDA